MRCGSRMPSLFITKRLLMPDAFSMNAELDSASASSSPLAMASACWSLYWRTKVLKLSTSSSLEML